MATVEAGTPVEFEGGRLDGSGEEDIRAAILGTPDLVVEAVEVPEWKRTCYIKELDAAETIKLTEQWGGFSPQMALIVLIIHTQCRSLTDRTNVWKEGDIKGLGSKNFAALERLQRVALRVNKMNKGAKAALKNALGGAPTGASPTDSPSPLAPVEQP